MDERVNQKTIAAYLGVSIKSIAAWQKRAKDPLPIAFRGGRGRGQSSEYDVPLCVKWYVRQEIGKLTGDVNGEIIDFNAERARLTKEQADKCELQNDVLRGDLLPADEVVMLWSRHIVAVKSQLRAIPSKLKTRVPALEQHEREVITRLLDRAMNELVED